MSLSLEGKLMAMFFLGSAAAFVSPIELQCAGLLLSIWVSWHMNTARHSHPLAFFMDGFVSAAVVCATAKFAFMNK